jgi:hypothetical protein
VSRPAAVTAGQIEGRLFEERTRRPLARRSQCGSGMKRTETGEALAEIDATIIAMTQMLKRLNADLLIGTKLLESRGARDRVTGAALSRSAQKEELRRRAQKQIDVLETIRAQMNNAKEGKE